jgi:hypothetical protein
MRLIIELTDEEARSTTITRRTTDERTGEQARPDETATSDGGSPPEELLLSLGAARQSEPVATKASGDTDAGESPGWLAFAVSGNGQG